MHQPSPSQSANPNEISEDDFESLLDDLHGSGTAPNGTISATSGIDATGSTVLPEALTIKQATDLARQLQDILSRSEDCQLDLSAVATIDTAGVQVLMAFSRAMEVSGYRVGWLSPSETVAKITKCLGVDLGIDSGHGTPVQA